jgi:hypothetical protein
MCAEPPPCPNQLSPQSGCRDLGARCRGAARPTSTFQLRHEALGRFFEMGLTTPKVASISGHRDPRMLFRYSHPMRQRVLEVIDRSDPSGGHQIAHEITIGR